MDIVCGPSWLFLWLFVGFLWLFFYGVRFSFFLFIPVVDARQCLFSYYFIAMCVFLTGLLVYMQVVSPIMM